MKIRIDFVTNSSSSSFILSFDNKEDLIKEAKELLLSNEAYAQFVNDVINASPLTKNEVDNRLNEEAQGDAYTYLNLHNDVSKYSDSELKEYIKKKPSWGYYSAGKPTFENNLKKLYPEYECIMDHPRYQDEMIRVATILKDTYKEAIKKKHIIELEYEDHTPVGCELEEKLYEIADLTFNHH